MNTSSGPWPLAGEMAGLMTAFLWSLSALAWSVAGRRGGAVPVATVRIWLASALLLAGHRVILGCWWPAGTGSRSILLLAASGILGAGIGDLCYFRGLVMIGPRLGTLVQAAAPAMTAVLAYLLPPHEALSLRSVAGIGLITFGVAWVVTETQKGETWHSPRRERLAGLAWALGGAAGGAGGYVLSKVGMGRAVDPLSASLVRVCASALFCAAVLPFLGKVRGTLQVLGDRPAMRVIWAGTLAGPVIGIWLSMAAVKWAPAGVASALIATSPIMMIPIAFLAHGDRPTPRAVAGTFAAVAGVALLVLRGQ